MDDILGPCLGTKADIVPFFLRRHNVVVFHRGDRPSASFCWGPGARFVNMTEAEDFYSGERVDGVVLAASDPLSPAERRFLARNAWPMALKIGADALLWIPL